jgi:hypothetical protein
MKKLVIFSQFIGVALLLASCGPKAEDINAPGNGLKSVSTTGKSSDQTPSSNTPEKGDTKSQTPALDISKIPAELKSDAFDYYGLGRTDPIKMTVTQNGTNEPATQTVKLTKIETGRAEFTITNEGGLSKLGEVLVSLDKDGVRIMSVNGQKAEADTFELPTGLTKGKTWPFKLPGSDQALVGSNVVKGTESVTTAVGTYKDALIVVSTASGKQNGQSVQVSMKNWLVKGRGLVKAEITNVSGKTKQSFSMAESK